ncbi:MAG: sulfatase-like hydrolase/transferase [Planctomycetota bacterium]
MGQPNLMIVMCDELRWCEPGCYGGQAKTPHLDALAARGVRCETAVSNAPVCMPARSVVLSGQHARTCTGFTNNTALRFARDADGSKGWCFDGYAPAEKCGFDDPTLAELLRDAGYHTRAIGKWHVDAWPHDLGFDRYLIPRNHHAHSAQPFCEDGGPELMPDGFSPDFEADRVCSFLAETHEKPWFLYYNLSPPHMPLADMPERYLTMFDAASVGRRGNVPDDFVPEERAVGAYLWDYRHYLQFMPHAVADAKAGRSIEALYALYLGATAWVDDLVGRVMQQLETTGQLDDTLVIFTSDHGDMMGSHGLMGKATLYEESYRIPMIAAGAGVPGGRVASDGVASLLDLAPTLLDAANQASLDHLQGTSLLPMFAGTAPGPEAAVIETSHDGTGLRTTSHLLALDRQDQAFTGNVRRFHDLTADPQQNQAFEDSGLRVDLQSRLADWDATTPWRAPHT